MDGGSPRVEREQRTIRAMIEMYCSAKHGRAALCGECTELLTYAMSRLNACPFGEGKPTCAKCAVHCYSGGYRERVRDVMRFSGPRMIYSHPFLAISHLLDGRRKPPQRMQVSPNGL
jgi:hypothetical protein